MASLLDPDVRRTMVAALVPDAEPLVGALRARFDPTARRGLGAHLTLVYPFLEPAAVDDAAVEALRDAVAPIAPFTCTFAGVRWFGRRVLWLAPAPVAPFREMAERVRRAVPAVPAADRELVPHLTVGLRRTASAEDLEAAAAALAPALPLVTRIDRVDLMARGATWTSAAAAPLAG